ncbi:hypothetical protein QJQ45_029235 [Haematococcus lacustris]|nr:hypothetical protein QJQ45_029235 [Haematococcus lacustris]
MCFACKSAKTDGLGIGICASCHQACRWCAMRSRGAMRGNHVDLAKPAVMQQHATRDTSIPNSAAATSTALKCAASQLAMKCGPASLRSHQSSAKRPACSSVSQPLAISERNRVFVIKHRVEGERHKGSLQRRRNQEEQPRGAARSGSQEQQLGAAARSGSQEAWARQVVGQGQEAHAPHSQEAQPGGRSSSQQGGSKDSAMAHGDNSVTVTRPPLAHPTPPLSQPTPPHPTPPHPTPPHPTPPHPTPPHPTPPHPTPPHPTPPQQTHGAGSLERAARSGQHGAGSLERAAWSGQPRAGSLKRAAWSGQPGVGNLEPSLAQPTPA